jgi:hypothetical protein
MAKQLHATMSLHNAHGVIEGWIWCEDSAKKESVVCGEIPNTVIVCDTRKVLLQARIAQDAQMNVQSGVACAVLESTSTFV